MPFGADQWPDGAAFLEPLPWLHSVVKSDDFLSPWGAGLSACELAWEVGSFARLCVPGRPPLREVTSSMSSSSHCSLPRSLSSCLHSGAPRRDYLLKNDHVTRFSDKVDVLLGSDVDLSMYACCVREGDLHEWSSKPWSLSSAAFDDDTFSLLAHQPVPLHVPLRVPPAALAQWDGVAHDPAHDPGDDDAEEGDSPSEDRTEHWQSAHIFQLRGPVLESRVRWDSYEKLHADVCALTGIPFRDLHSIFEVESRPDDLASADISPLLVRQGGDFPIGDDYRMVLLDFQLHEHSKCFLIKSDEVIY